MTGTSGTLLQRAETVPSDCDPLGEIAPDVLGFYPPCRVMAHDQISRQQDLVFYLPDEAEWRQAIQRLESRGYTPVQAFNP
jgi:hypothetical protein